jgi:F-type H+-transporting ATPase subunit gamma
VKGTFDELYVVYNEFKSAIQQRVIVEKLFPIDAAAEFGAAPSATGQSCSRGQLLV